MKSSGRNISFLVSKEEFKLIEDACEYGADAEHILDKAKHEKSKLRLTFSYEELDDLAGFLASDANAEESDKKQKKLDALCNRIENLLKLSEGLQNQKLIKSPQEAARPSLYYFIFDVWLERENKKKVVRTLQIASVKSLYNFAKVITKAFGFYFDHCFAFYEKLEDHFFKGKAFELFVDIGEEHSVPGAKGVKKVRIEQAFKSAGDKMVFLFDYGDGWQFFVELKEIKQADKWDLKPVVLQSIGKAPLQYPPLNEEHFQISE